MGLRYASERSVGIVSRPVLPESAGNAAAEFLPSDSDLGEWVQVFDQLISLPAQRKAILSASDYEMQRARRIVHLVFGHLGRLTRAAPNEGASQPEEFCRPLPIVLGRPAVPILIMILRDDMRRRQFVPLLLELSLQMRRPLSPQELESFRRGDYRGAGDRKEPMHPSNRAT
jgi:hypothetical protein